MNAIKKAVLLATSVFALFIVVVVVGTSLTLTHFEHSNASGGQNDRCTSVTAQK